MTSHSVPKGHAGEAVMNFIDKFYEHTPGFQVIHQIESFL